jgi:two-component system sensor histidine kinase TctE
LAERRPASLRRRLILWLTLATLAIGLVALADTRAEALRTARDVSDRVLAGAAMAIAERASIGASGGVEIAIPFSALDMLSSVAQDQVFYRVDGPGGFLTGYEDLPPAPGVGRDSPAFADDRFLGTAIRKATVLRELTGGGDVLPVTVTVAESTRARDGLAASILARSALRIAGLIAAAAVVVWVAATIALRPLDRLSAALADRAPHDLTPIESDAPAELRPVLVALNGFLARLKESTLALQNFAGNANHQIRTPLAVARTRIGLALREPGGTEALEKADQALVRAERVLSQLLLLARVQATGTGPELRAADVSALARGVVEEALPEAIRLGMDLGFEGPPGLVARTDEVLLQELVRNLVGNALAHCPAGTEVTVRLEATDRGPRLSVTDNGPPLGPEGVERLRQRLRAGAGGGQVRTGPHGLGLPIVAEIARALALDLALGPGPDGRGLSVRVEASELGR